MSGIGARQADDLINSARQERSNVYDHVDAAADIFLNNAGQMYLWRDAVTMVANELSIGEGTANAVIENLANDQVDPVTVVRNSEGRFVGVAGYAERDFYYEFREFHDVLGEVTTGACVPCVEEATFDHQVAQFPDHQQYLKQRTANVGRPGHGTIPRDATETERRDKLGAHYLTEHTDIQPSEVAESVGPGVDQVASDVGVDDPGEGRTNADVVNERFTHDSLMENYGISFDQIKNSAQVDTGVDQITVGASLVSGTTIAGNTAVHGGNQGSFNVEDFGTSSTTSGEVPQADGSGGLTMGSVSGSGVWTEDANSPLTISSSSSAQYTLNGTYDQVMLIVSNDSSTNSPDIDLRVNGDSGTNYSTRLWNGNTSSDSFVKAVLQGTYAAGATIWMSGQWDSNWTCGVMGGAGGGNNTHAVGGSNASVASPLDTFTLLDDAATSFSLTVNVFGYSA